MKKRYFVFKEDGQNKNSLATDAGNKPSAVLVQGEFTYSYAIIGYLLQAKIDVLAACSERCTECFVNEQQETVKRSVYKFVRFRSYR